MWLPLPVIVFIQQDKGSIFCRTQIRSLRNKQILHFSLAVGGERLLIPYRSVTVACTLSKEKSLKNALHG